jgi:hypothetical protein
MVYASLGEERLRTMTAPTSPIAAVLTKHRPNYSLTGLYWFCTGCPYAGVGWGQWVEHADAMIAETLTPAPALREWCCRTPITGPHTPGCDYEPRPDNPLDYTGPALIAEMPQ